MLLGLEVKCLFDKPVRVLYLTQWIRSDIHQCRHGTRFVLRRVLLQVELERVPCLLQRCTQIATDFIADYLVHQGVFEVEVDVHPRNGNHRT